MMEDHHLCVARHFQGTRDVTKETIKSQNGNKEAPSEFEEAIASIKAQMCVAAWSSSKASQPLPSKVPKEENVLDTAAPMAEVQLIEDRGLHLPRFHMK